MISPIVAHSEKYRIEKFVNDSFNGSTLFSNTSSTPSGRTVGLSIDVNYNIYATDFDNHQVVTYTSCLNTGTILARGGSPGSMNNQFFTPYGSFSDTNNTLCVGDTRNNRVMKDIHGSTAGSIAAGTNNSPGSGSHQLQNPAVVIVYNNDYAETRVCR